MKDVIQRILETCKVDVNAKDTVRGMTPLCCAAKNGHKAVVELLLATGQADVELGDGSDRTPLSFAAEAGHTAVIQLLLDTGNVNVNAKDFSGRTPLIFAAMARQTKTVLQLF
ncbi:ankyrin, partial [Viridothelium virens]